MKNDNITKIINDYMDPVNQLPSNRHEKYDRIKKGPFQPIMTFPRRQIGSSSRSFHASWYKDFSWLEYSLVLDAAFCFVCRCFGLDVTSHRGHADTAYTTTGFRGWNIATKKFKLHQMSSIHKSSVTSLSVYLKGNPIDVQLEKEKEKFLSKQEERRLQNHVIMKRLIDIIITITKGARALRGHNESSKSLEKGLFLEIVELISRYDIVLQNHLKNAPKNATYVSGDIQNDIINSIQTVMLRSIRSIISSINSKPISIIADETTDLGHHEQLSLVIRYFDEDVFRPIERFIGLYRVRKVDAQSIFDELSSTLTNLRIEWNDIMSVCFDGAATMSGSIAGVQKKCKEKNSCILYVHCYAHCLNLVLVDACTSIKENHIIFDFFGVIQLTYAFIESSAVRHAVLENISEQINISLKTMKSLSTTRWACRSEAVNAIKHNYYALIQALEHIIDTTKQTDVRAKGRGLLFQLRHFNFILGLNIMDPILAMINKVNKYLQGENCDLLSAMNNVKSLRCAIIDMRSEIEYKCIYNSTVLMCEKLNVEIPKLKVRKISCKIDSFNSNQFSPTTKEQETRFSTFFPMLDSLINGLDERFNQETVNIISAVNNLLNLDITKPDCNILSTYFKCNEDELISEIRI